MRILHVGFGFRPWSVTGLTIYNEAVMEGQALQGHEVGYFFPARQLPLVRRTFVHRWHRRGVEMFELINSTLIVGRHRGTPAPQDDLDHEPTEAVFSQVLEGFRPDLVHVHDLGGLPSSILEICRRRDVPTVMTLHDYHPLCPTVKLYDAHDRICLRHDPGAMCAICCADAPTDKREDLAETLAYVRRRVRDAIPPLDAALRRPEAQGLAVAGIRLMERGIGVRHERRSPGAPGREAPIRSPHASAAAYQRRRDLNVERLSRVDALVASSTRAAEIYRELGVSAARIRIVQINPPHIERLRPKHQATVGVPLRFVVLNAASSTQKGADLIVEALSILSHQGFDHRYRVAVHGWVDEQVRPALAAHPGVDLHGPYRADQLDALLDEGDVGLFPSVWEETYGFVGLEFLAKGIPVIGNAIGSIPEYVRPGETGWLNRSRSAAELAQLMAAAIDDPAEVRRLGDRALALRDELIRPFAAGLAELDELYRELVSEAPCRSPS